MKRIIYLLLIIILVIGLVGTWAYSNNQTQRLQSLVQQKDSSIEQLNIDINSLSEQVKKLQQNPIDTIKQGDIPIDTIKQGDIYFFVNNSKFPKQQEINIFLDITEQKVKLFDVRYGEPRDCPSGCFFSMALGIQNSDKFGWITIEDYDNIDKSNLLIYNFGDGDGYLYSKDFFDKFKSSNSWGYQNAFLPLVAKDSDTPKDTLLRIADGLSSYIQPSLAKSLLENTKVISDKEILTIIANLPVFSGDAYKDSRLEAQTLLNQLK